MVLSDLLKSSFQTADVPQSVFEFIQSILKGRNPIGVIYYGSSLWKQDLSGLLDFYIVCEDLSDWYQGKTGYYLANKLLPPNIEYHEFTHREISFRAKVAILSLEQLRRATGLQSIDTTMWARFCQPVKVLWVRDQSAYQDIFRCLVRAVTTASWWAASLGSKEGRGEDFWCNLFAHTYRAELRVETKNRPMSILENREDYFTQLLESAWHGLGVSFSKTQDNCFIVNLSNRERTNAQKKWKLRQWLGRPLNIARLTKAAFTFRGGADYIAWKINRHQGIELHLTAFQKKHPLINAPWILIKLYRHGVFKN
ncbi:hypothetical protein [Commensalibacter nepenthis]|uniref:Adenylyltransferase AadA C-terminal domain-containing protein n=1 Tax=Commensalibacter nepenthis TaxID=3043872 RepID=A0ABT6Q7W4_9PROT|nr:hypothetical protein [Commensalibacter sp. TBRC 10068]MDI2112985.1 hypothetical protein [Commensalibacter sp. TBRC 10068]